MLQPASVFSHVHSNAYWLLVFDIFLSGSFVYLKGEQVISGQKRIIHHGHQVQKLLFMINALTPRPPGESALFLKESFVLVCR